MEVWRNAVCDVAKKCIQLGPANVGTKYEVWKYEGMKLWKHESMKYEKRCVCEVGK